MKYTVYIYIYIYTILLYVFDIKNSFYVKSKKVCASLHDLTISYLGEGFEKPIACAQSLIINLLINY